MSKQAKQTMIEKRNVMLAEAAQYLLTPGNKITDEKYRSLSDAIAVLDDDLSMLTEIQNKLGATRAREVEAASVISQYTSPEARKKAQGEALRKYMLNGSSSETRDLLTTNAGAVIPTELYGNLFERLANYAKFVGLVTTAQETNGRPTLFFTSDDTSNFLAVQTTEGSTPASEQDPTFSRAVLTHDTLIAKTLVSYQTLSDSAFSIDAILNASAVRMLGRAVETAVLNSVDPANGALANQAGVLANVAVGTTTTALAGGIGYDDLVNVVGSLDAGWLPNASWVFSYPVFVYLLGLKDAMGRPYFDSLYTNRTLLGFPVVLTSSKAMVQNVTTANSLPILFGDWRAAIGLSMSDLSVKKTMETHMDTLEAAFYMYARVASKILVPQSIVGLRLAAS